MTWHGVGQKSQRDTAILDFNDSLDMSEPESIAVSLSPPHTLIMCISAWCSNILPRKRVQNDSCERINPNFNDV